MIRKKAKDWADQKVGWRDILPALILLAAAFVSLTMMALMSVTVPGQYLVVMNFGSSRAEILDIVFRARGGVVGFGGLSNIAIAASDDPGFKQSVSAGGALFVMPSPRLLGCFTSIEQAGP